MHVMTPFVYCEYRDQNDGNCSHLASGRIEGMAFCEAHVKAVERGIEDSGVALVKDEIVDLRRKAVGK